MASHLSPLSLFEWARDGALEYAPETPFRMEAHLGRCAACRGQIDAYRALHRSVEPWGAPLVESWLRRLIARAFSPR